MERPKIPFRQFLLAQPSFPEEQPTDKTYWQLAEKIADSVWRSGLATAYHPLSVNRLAVDIVGYLQDVVADAGLWHGFTDRCRDMYGSPVPFYPEGDNYMDYELNEVDVRFLTWYSLTMRDLNHRLDSPSMPVFRELGKIIYDELENEYENVPMPEGYVFSRELEMHDPDDRETIYELSRWLFLHSYLLTPAYALNFAEIASNVGDDTEKLKQALSEGMSRDATGPLAYYTSEWTWLVAEHRLPPKPRSKKEEPDDHPYYSKFVEATGGKTIAFFKDYADLNRFFIDGMGWEKDREHLDGLRNASGFVLMVTRKKGMLIAPEVAKMVAAPDNPLYDPAYARDHAIELLTERGACPHDLLERILKEGWLPDAHFPGADDHQLVARNADFISRCYLLDYYRAL